MELHPHDGEEPANFFGGSRNCVCSFLHLTHCAHKTFLDRGDCEWCEPSRCPAMLGGPGPSWREAASSNFRPSVTFFFTDWWLSEAGAGGLTTQLLQTSQRRSDPVDGQTPEQQHGPQNKEDAAQAEHRPQQNEQTEQEPAEKKQAALPLRGNPRREDPMRQRGERDQEKTREVWTKPR